MFTQLQSRTKYEKCERSISSNRHHPKTQIYLYLHITVVSSWTQRANNDNKLPVKRGIQVCPRWQNGIKGLKTMCSSKRKEKELKMKVAILLVIFPLVSANVRPESISEESTEVALSRPKRQIYYLCGSFPNQYLSLTRKLFRLLMFNHLNIRFKSNS